MLVDSLLGEEKVFPNKIDRILPLSAERRATAISGILHAAEAKWGLGQDHFKSIRHLRRTIQHNAASNPSYKRSAQAILYQQTTNTREDLADALVGIRDFLHFGKPSHSTETAADKLDEIVRVYVYTPPEFCGHVAAEAIRQVRERLGRDLYLKLEDTTTAGNDGSARIDGLVIYGHTHGEMVVVADTLRELAIKHPAWFDMDAAPTDLAIKTSIPGVAIAEEPKQDGTIPESFNSHRATVKDLVVDAVSRHYFGQPKIKQKFRLSDDDVRRLSIDKDPGRSMIRDDYKSRSPEERVKMHDALRRVLRKKAREMSPRFNISSDSFAMNSR